jgi:hypothetical protein
VQKSKTDPLLCHAGNKGERRYSSYSFLTSALDGGEWSASCHGCTLPQGKDLWHHWIGECVEEESFASVRDQTRVVQSIVRHYTD